MSITRFSLDFINRLESNEMLDISIIKKMNPSKKSNIGGRNTVSDFFCRIPEYMDEKTIKRKLSKYLNMINESNFDKILNNILGILIKDDIKGFLLNHIFNTAIKQDIYIDIYIKIFKELINDKEYGTELKECYKKTLEKKIKDLSNIKSVNPNDNYDDFCKSLKNKNILKNVYIFIAKTYKEKLYLINNKQLHTMINNIFENIKKCEKTENEMNIIILKSLLINLKNKVFYNNYKEKINLVKKNAKLNMRGKFMLLDISDYYK